MPELPAPVERLVPAWLRKTAGEQRWPVALSILLAIALQLPAAHILRFPRTTLRWVLPVLETLLLAALVISDPGRIERRSRPVRLLSIVLVSAMTLANATLAWELVYGLAQGKSSISASQLLLAGGAIWMTNVIAFAVWYWEFDRGGPGARAEAVKVHPDFLFPQMTDQSLSHPDWEPQFVDYLFVAYTNATAFSPTDVLPLTRWAKMAMMLQSAVSIATVALVVARAVNILGS